jgi:Sap, sulfolipid-1-addressing protein
MHSGARSMLIQIFVLAVGSMFWPVVLAVDVVAFKADRPVKILGGFLAGGIVATVTVGCVIVLSLEHTSLVTKSKHTTDPVVSIVVGLAALVAALLVRRRDKQGRDETKPKTPSRVDRLGGYGVALAFVTGIVLNVFPGVLPLLAMKDMGELNYTTAATIAVVLAFYVVMFAPAEVPLVAFLVAPKRTAQAVDSFNVWLARNLHRLAWSALAIFGAYEIVRGVLTS